MSFNNKLPLIIKFIISLAAIVFFIYIFSLIYSEITSSTVPYDTDEADHTNPPLQLYTSILRGDPELIYDSIFRQAFYPPIYSFVVSAFYLILSPDFVSSRLPTLFSFIVYILLIIGSVKTFLIKEKSSIFASTAAILTATLAITSPITLYNSILCMLEIPGMLTVTICIYAFIGLQTNPSNLRILLLSIAGLLVFFTKYNFGIITIPAVIATVFFSTNFKTALKALIFTLIPIGIWALLTDFPQFMHFFKGHKSYAPMFSNENIFFEFRSWINSYCANSYIAIAVLLIALLGFMKYFRKPAAQFAFFNTAAAFSVLLLSTTNEERHFMVAIPGILFLSGLGIFYLARLLNNIKGSLVYLATFSLIVSVFISNLPATKLELKRQFEGEQTFLELFEFIYANTDSSSPVLIYGISDDFSIEALRWYYAAKSKKLYTETNVDAYPFRPDKNFTARMRNRNLDKPFQEKGFPTKPFLKVIAKDYYKYAVHINNTSKKQRFLKEGNEFAALLSNNEIARKSSGSREVAIYKIAPAM